LGIINIFILTGISFQCPILNSIFLSTLILQNSVAKKKRSGHSPWLHGITPILFVLLEYCKPEIYLYWKQRHACMRVNQ